MAIKVGTDPQAGYTARDDISKASAVVGLSPAIPLLSALCAICDHGPGVGYC